MSRLKCLGNRIKSIGNYIIEGEIVYGYLYNWWVTQQDISSSEDWKVASDIQWTTLINYIISKGYPNNSVANSTGNALRSCRQVNSPLGGNCATSEHPRWDLNSSYYGTNNFNFSAFPGGYRHRVSGNYTTLGYYGTWWSSTSFSSTSAWSRGLANYDVKVIRYLINKVQGFSIRLVREATLDEQSLTDGSYCASYRGNDYKIYQTVKIGTQVWIVQNLAETKYRNGDLIPFEATEGQGNYSNPEWTALTTPARCTYNDNESLAIKKVPIPIPLRVKYV